MMEKYLGNFAEDSIVYCWWNTFDATGGSITRATNGTITVYKDDSTSGSTAGITDNEDFNSVTGVHLCEIDLSADEFYAPGHDYAVVLSAAAIDGETVNAVLGTFSIENRHGDIAAKMLVNKAVQNKATGVIEYYGSDGETVILTHTPADTESEITRNAS